MPSTRFLRVVLFLLPSSLATRLTSVTLYFFIRTGYFNDKQENKNNNEKVTGSGKKSEVGNY